VEDGEGKLQQNKMHSNVSTNYPATEAATEDSSFPSNLSIETTGILCASKHLQTAFKIKAVSLEMFFANLLYMNACSSL
jgi:hypothetical protein